MSWCTRIGQRLLRVFAPESAVADPAESGADRDPDVVVDEHSARPDLPAHPQRAIAVLGEHRRNQSERRAVGDPTASSRRRTGSG